MRERGHDDSKACTEVRWFLDGDVAALLVDRPRPDKQRVDSYHLGSLTETSAWKRRGRRDLLEHKVRSGAPRPIAIGELSAWAERWTKRRIGDRPHLAGPWVEVDKQIWVIAGVEVARLEVEATIAWTVSVNLDAPRLKPATTTVLERWTPLLRTRAFNGSYPAWLLAHCDDKTSRLPVYAHQSSG